jgi:hypothetical protein
MIGTAHDAEDDKSAEEKYDRTHPLIVHQRTEHGWVRGAMLDGPTIPRRHVRRGRNATVLVVCGVTEKIEAEADNQKSERPNEPRRSPREQRSELTSGTPVFGGVHC